MWLRGETEEVRRRRPASQSRGRKAGTILVAEDQAVNQLLVEALLHSAGHSCDIVGDGFQALEAASERDYDLILMDIRMPNLSGYDAAERIRLLPGEAARVPIIAMSASIPDFVPDSGQHAIFDDFLPKPIRRAEFLAKVERWCASRVVHAHA